MKNALSALALAAGIETLGACTTHTRSSRAVALNCLQLGEQRHPEQNGVASAPDPALPRCHNQTAEDYLRAQIVALRPRTPREIRYDTRRILMLAISEDEGEEEATLQAELQARQPCAEGERNVGIVRTQIYGNQIAGPEWLPSSITERLVFTSLDQGQFSIVPDLAPQISGTIHTCRPDRMNLYHRYECSHFPRDRYDPHSLLNWSLRLKDRPGVAICFSPSINEPTICGFAALSDYARQYGLNPVDGIKITAYGNYGSRPAELLIN